ncbi:L-2,4-diaminobutyrate decarboxylase [Streptomyces sp. 1114.5]|uniref:pyridoxal phosphate-dependent decarboxylase family protein n=1 Tax=unclassified Streptomyces TaxID=2593676 RepID=UPI000BCD2DFF|nr:MULTISPECIES: pyridoxal-dependent decarboxylase [unclassified Streptomyces]RKT11661.1 L-2,4-diaminobutyrate decarboxylase [Streptomyces sp. 1114.5]SOB80765.1 L-2,4-diaminobutyrate decarboxylase [Streptomyces sp. 1331.2]
MSGTGPGPIGLPGGEVPADALAGGAGGPGALGPLLATVLDALDAGTAMRSGPLPAGSPAEITALVGDALATADGRSALARLTELLAYGAADPADPACAAHLHCPPLAVAAAADLAVSALNPSQDSWDQAPAATALETALLAELAELVGYDPRRSAGVLTSGGTESNLMGLMLARDQKLDGIVELDGIPAGVRPCIIASEAAHFSVQRAAALLGLGERAVVSVPVDRQLRMRESDLERALAEASWAGRHPIAVVATAGTTDTGAIDPLPTAADLAGRYGAWLHVDAAYGGGALLSDRLAPLLDGIARADSVSLDWHKLGWQPAAAGVFLVRRAETYVSLARRAEYLNPVDDEQAGYPSLLGRSLRTTRRADAFKLAVTLRTLGRDGLGRLVDACHDLAHAAADAVRADPSLELHDDPVLTTVLFRYRPPGVTDEAALDEVNGRLRRLLLRSGRAVVGRTELPGDGPGRVRLKLTLLNPHTTAGEVGALLREVVGAGRKVAGERAG